MKLLVLSLSLISLGQVLAAEPNDVESATRRGLARVKQAASDWQNNKTCFSCHHQTLPMLAALEGERVGFPLDKAWLRSQADTTHKYFEDRIDMLEEAERLPGGAATTGFGFWALSLDQRPPDKTTAAMVKYLLQIQGVKRADERDPKKLPSLEDGRWIATCRRQPMQASMIADTVLVLIGLEKYATPEQRAGVAKAREAADKWLAQAPVRDQQDRLWRMWGLHHFGGDDAAKRKVRTAILAAQNADGGWGEDAERPQSDAYTTGQALYMLLKTGTPRDDPRLLRARDWLLRTQLADGSWKAGTHTKVKGQPYFDNGDPHGESQFLSTAATAWATAGLAILIQP